MKKLIALILTLILACAAMMACAEEEEKWTDFHCEEMQFTMKVPEETLTRYEEEVGVRIYMLGEGSIPYVQVYRRPLEYKFSNPVGYLNNVYREYLEDKYQGDSLGMNPAQTFELGGRELLGARYYYRISGVEVTQLLLIDIRDGGDVEFTAKFYEGNEEITLAALEEAVLTYLEDEVK